jgi:alpha-amylase/alpha-mannosidase (GH57 family)
MKRRELSLIWHVHQPFFVPDEEVLEQLICSYRPLLALHRELGVPLSLNICGGLLERLATLAPAWIEGLRTAIDGGLVELLGSGKFHPLLPLLPHERARAQVRADLEAKARILHVEPQGFWPTDLGWTHALVPILAEAGLRWVVVDSSAKVAASALPAWQSTTVAGHRVLRPQISPLVGAAELGAVHRLRLGDTEVFALLRHHELSWDLVDQQEGVLHHPELLDEVLDRVEAHYASGASLLILGDDGERIHPQTLITYRRLLEALRQRGIALVTGSAALEARIAEATEAYLPTSTFLIDFSAWLTTPDDLACLRQLDEVQRLFEDVRRRVRRQGNEEAQRALVKLEGELAKTEDSALYFWKYLRRTREPFLDTLARLRSALDELDLRP